MCFTLSKRFCSVKIYTKIQYTRERASIGSKRIRTPNSFDYTSKIANPYNLTISSERFNRSQYAFVAYTSRTYCVFERRRVADKGPLKMSYPRGLTSSTGTVEKNSDDYGRSGNRVSPLFASTRTHTVPDRTVSVTGNR